MSGFPDGRLREFVVFLSCFGPSRVLLFGPIFEKNQFLAQNCRPTVFAYSITFWLDFQGWQASNMQKQCEKRSMENHRLLKANKSGSKSVFIDLGVISGLHFWTSRSTQNQIIQDQFTFLSGEPPGSFWDHFWLRFGTIVGLF